MKNCGAVTIVGFVIAAGLWGYYGAEETVAEQETLSPTHSPQAADIATEVAVTERAPPQRALVKSPSAVEGEESYAEDSTEPRTISELAPSLEDLRSEVAANPHVTPTSLLQFSISLYEKMQMGLQSEKKAESLFRELEACALGDEQKGNTSVQAVCILNAKRAQTTYPTLSRRYENMVRQADSAAVKIMDQIPQ